MWRSAVTVWIAKRDATVLVESADCRVSSGRIDWS
jgi:hypothetical protein